VPLAGDECLVAAADPALAATLVSHIEALGGTAIVIDAAQAKRTSQPPRLVAADLACRDVLESPVLRDAPIRLLVAPSGDASATTLPSVTAVLCPPVTYTQLADFLDASCSRQTGEPATPQAATYRGRLSSLGARILLVEDNPVNRLVAGAMLEQLGLDFDWAGDGSDALAKLEQERFDLVLMDMEMPVMDGVEATRELRRREAAGGRKRLPVIAMTANALAQDRARCLEAGMDAHLGKPVCIEELGDMLERWLGDQPQQVSPLRRPLPEPEPMPC
jgi:CheY-like chemotaxis protein